MPIINRIAEFHPEMTAWRRDFHEHPELGLEEVRTSRIIAEKLRDFGCDEVVTGIAKTGVVGVIRGRTDNGRAIGLRADIDALPIHEETGLPYASKIPGKMHAGCREIPGRNPQFRRHGLCHFPAGGRKPGRRRIDGKGRAVHALPDGTCFRHA
jgi:hypothetical protein